MNQAVTANVAISGCNNSFIPKVEQSESRLFGFRKWPTLVTMITFTTKGHEINGLLKLKYF